MKPFKLRWPPRAAQEYEKILSRAKGSTGAGPSKASRQIGLFKQVTKALKLLAANPRHPGLRTHPYSSLPHPYDKDQKVFEAYAQNKTPGAYRIFWCHGPGARTITVIAITPHP